MLDRIKITLTLVFAALVLGQAGRLNAADANPPERMTYQGYLVDGNGDPLGGSVPANYDVVFRIYNVKQGGTSLWAEQQTVTVDKGYFSVLLGEGSQYGSESHGALSAVFDGGDASDRFIGITVGGLGGADVEIAPRLRLISSPFAFTATNARRLTDGSGNANFFKDDTSLKLGAGSSPTLTLPEAGGATLQGKLTTDLPSWGSGLQIDNGSLVTTMGAQNSSLFHFQTGLPQFYFNKGLTVNGDIRSYLRDTVIGPSNNTDTYLMIGSGSDKITAKADEFVVQGDTKWLKSQFTSSAAELRTNASKFYLDKSLEVEGSLSVKGLLADNLTIWKPDNDEAVLSAYGNSQGTGRLYLGQSTDYGGGIIYNGDGAPAFSGSSTDHISFYRTSNNVHHEVFKYSYNNNDVIFNGSVKLGGSHGLRTVTGDFGSVQTVGSKNGWAGYSIEGRYALMASNTHNDGFGLYDDANNRWMIYTRHSNGTRYASYDGDQNWDFYSDIRLKENIEKESSILNRIMKLDVVKYDFIGEKRKKYKELGFIAQEVEPLFPSIVSEQDDDRHEFKVKSLGYTTFGVIAIGGIKELKNEKDNEIAELRSENETLKSKMETLTSEMAVLKARLANKTTQEDRIAKLEEIVSRIGQGE